MSTPIASASASSSPNITRFVRDVRLAVITAFEHGQMSRVAAPVGVEKMVPLRLSIGGTAYRAFTIDGVLYVKAKGPWFRITQSAPDIKKFRSSVEAHFINAWEHGTAKKTQAPEGWQKSPQLYFTGARGDTKALNVGGELYALTGGGVWWEAK